MKYAVDGHLGFRVLVKDCVGKSTQKCPAITFMNHGMSFGGPAYSTDTSVNTGKKFLAETCPPLFVPPIGLDNIPRRLRGELVTSVHDVGEPDV
jgi:hypothetical protein